MTILHVSDFHFNKAWFHWLRHHAPPHDVLAMAGDLLDLSSPTPQRKQIAWVSDWINDYAGAICLCSGNHDLEWDAETERWTPAYWLRDIVNPRVWRDGQRVTFDGLSILTIGCTTRPKGGVADVWVVHAPPSGTPVAARTKGGDGGDRDLVPALRRYRPRFVLTGHVHDPVAWHHRQGYTHLLNPGCDPKASVPQHILIRTDEQVCEFIGSRHTERHTLAIPSTNAMPAAAAVCATS